MNPLLICTLTIAAIGLWSAAIPLRVVALRAARVRRERLAADERQRS